MEGRSYLLAISTALAGALIAGAICVSGRWQLAASNGAEGGGFIHRLDRWTGEVAECNATPATSLMAKALGAGALYRCTPVTRAEAISLQAPVNNGPGTHRFTDEEADKFLGTPPPAGPK
jgi:hypothetical protein